MAVAKGIASGLPLSATVASKELMKQWPLGSHGTTFGGNPIACAAGLATLEVLKEEKLVENAKAMGSYATTRLLEMKERYASVGSIRSIGLMIGIEIVDPVTGDSNGEGVINILNKSLEKGVLFYLCGNEGEVIRMIPPLTVNKEQIDEGLSLLEASIAEYEAEIQVPCKLQKV